MVDRMHLISVCTSLFYTVDYTAKEVLVSTFFKNFQFVLVYHRQIIIIKYIIKMPLICLIIGSDH